MVQNLMTLCSWKVGLLMVVFIFLVYLITAKLGSFMLGNHTAKVDFMTLQNTKKSRKSIPLKIMTDFFITTKDFITYYETKPLCT